MRLFFSSTLFSNKCSEHSAAVKMLSAVVKMLSLVSYLLYKRPLLVDYMWIPLIASFFFFFFWTGFEVEPEFVLEKSD